MCSNSTLRSSARDVKDEAAIFGPYSQRCCSSGGDVPVGLSWSVAIPDFEDWGLPSSLSSIPGIVALLIIGRDVRMVGVQCDGGSAIIGETDFAPPLGVPGQALRKPCHPRKQRAVARGEERVRSWHDAWRPREFGAKVARCGRQPWITIPHKGGMGGTARDSVVTVQ